MREIIHMYTQWVRLVEEELLTLPKHMISPQVFNRVRIAQYLVFCVNVCPFVLFTIVLSAFLQFTASDFSFDIFKLFLHFNVIMSAFYETNILVGFLWC